MAATQHSSPPPNLFNIVEHNNNNNNHKQHKSKHGEQEEDQQQEVFEYYSQHDDEPPQPSCGSSPSHEFSFTVCSIYSSPTTTVAADKNVLKESFTNSYSTAIDLSPADEIFLHGHLLPLHLLSGGQFSISPPRSSSTNSLDGSSVIPITSLFSNPSIADSSSSTDQDSQDRVLDNNNNMEKPKSRSFSLFRNRVSTTSKTRKQLPHNQEIIAESKSKPHQDGDNTNNHNHKNLNKVKFDLSNAIKQYAKLVRPLLTFKQGNSISNNSGGDSSIQQRGQTFSYSGNLSNRRRSNKLQGGDESLRGRFSAPASMRTSPTNSSMFLEASRSNNSSSSSSDSSMEELQAAIQAAIAHCKNSSSIASAAAVQDN